MTAALEMPCHFAALRLDAHHMPEPVALQGRLACWLEETGHGIDASGTLPDGALWVRTPEATIRLATEGPDRLTVHVAERATAEQTPAGEALLLHLVYRLAARLTPDRIEWQAPGSWLDAREFMQVAGRVAGSVRPARPVKPRPSEREAARPAQLPAEPDPTESLRLRAAFRALSEEQEAPAPSPQIRCAAWALSGAAGILCVPLAPVLLAVNLRQGADLRLAAQACALIGLFFALDDAGALQQVAAMMPV
jgi:hypothetical protein